MIEVHAQVRTLATAPALYGEMHLCSQLAEEFAGKPEETLLRRLGQEYELLAAKAGARNSFLQPELELSAH